jgi:hypothetical protein
MRSVLNIGLACVLALAFVSCAQPPEEELKAAEAAIAKAQSAEADIYATEVFRNAKNTLADARAKVEKSDYEGAKASAIRAKELADQSASQAASSKSQMSQQATALVGRLATGLADARAALEGAPKGKGADENLDQLRSDLGQAEASANDAKTSLGSGKAKDALAQAKAAEGKLTQVQSGLQTAMKKIADWQEEHKAWYLR